MAVRVQYEKVFETEKQAEDEWADYRRLYRAYDPSARINQRDGKWVLVITEYNSCD